MADRPHSFTNFKDIPIRSLTDLAAHKVIYAEWPRFVDLTKYAEILPEEMIDLCKSVNKKARSCMADGYKASLARMFRIRYRLAFHPIFYARYTPSKTEFIRRAERKSYIRDGFLYPCDCGSDCMNSLTDSLANTNSLTDSLANTNSLTGPPANAGTTADIRSSKSVMKIYMPLKSSQPNVKSFGGFMTQNTYKGKEFIVFGISCVIDSQFKYGHIFINMGQSWASIMFLARNPYIDPRPEISLQPRHNFTWSRKVRLSPYI